MTRAFAVYGMHCQHCVDAVRKAVLGVPGVIGATVALPPGLDAANADVAAQAKSLAGQVTIEGNANEAALNVAIVAAGYALAPPASDVRTSEQSLAPAAAHATQAAATEALGTSLQIEGMTCATCVATVERALAAVHGVQRASVNFADESAWVEGTVSTEALLLAVRRAGYEATPHAPEDGADDGAAAADGGARALLLRAALALVAGVAFMYLDMHWGLPTGVAGVAMSLSCLAFMAGCGGRYYRGALASARRRAGTMDTLIATGTGSAWLYSTVQVLAPQWLVVAPDAMRMGEHVLQHGFFDAALMIIGFVSLGQGLELRARRSSSRAIRELLALAPEHALRMDGDGEHEVPLAQVRVGDWLRVRPGERVPVDARIIDGVSHIDESMLTGEPMPVRRGEGDEVAAGTLNGSQALVVEAIRVGSVTALARIVALVRRAQGAKPALAVLADRIAGVFVPTVLVVAVITAATWYFLGPEPSAPFALTTALAVLIIACPCALGLATPLSVLIAVGRAARLGVLVRDGRALEEAGRVELLLLDKTGTLTVGRPELREVFVAVGIARELALSFAAALASASSHPVSRAIARAAEQAGSSAGARDALRAAAVEELPGSGLVGTIDGAVCLLGQLSLLESRGVTGLDDARALAADDATLAHLARDGHWLASFAVGDALRPDAIEALVRLRDAGVEVMLISGDQPAAVAAMAARAGIALWRGGATPADKLKEIEAQRARARVVGMVGDGINDAPALAAADVGFAMSQGTAVAIESADVTLLRQSLHAVADAVLLSRATRANIRENLAGAFLYNVLAIPIAAGVLWPLTGWLLSPMLGSAAMAASSLTVVANALRLRGVPLQRFLRRPQ